MARWILGLLVAFAVPMAAFAKARWLSVEEMIREATAIAVVEVRKVEVVPGVEDGSGRGKVQHALYGVTPKGHAAEILGLLKTL